MTTAVCFKCGAIKFGAFNNCPVCNSEPITEEDFIMSVAMTDHYFDENALKTMGSDIKAGKELKLTPETREYLSKSVGVLREYGLLETPKSEKKNWWKFWRR
ncbi:MAG: hypothetical protein ACOYN6_05220 [Ignavibacteria bacterium]